MTPGYTYTQEFWDLADSGVLTVEEAPSDEANLKKLQAGRIDLFLAGERIGWYLARRIAGAAAEAEFAVVPHSVAVLPAYLLISRQHPGAETVGADLQAAFDAARISERAAIARN